MLQKNLAESAAKNAAQYAGQIDFLGLQGSEGCLRRVGSCGHDLLQASSRCAVPTWSSLDLRIPALFIFFYCCASRPNNFEA